MKRLHLKRPILSLAGSTALLVTTGCMYSPYDYEFFAHATDAIPFSGCSVTPNSPIVISAALPPSLLVGGPAGSWDVQATTVSPGSVTATDSTGLKWYCWSTNVVIQNGEWQGGAPVSSSVFTMVKVTDSGGPVATYLNDPQKCTKPYGYPQITGAAPCAVQPGSSGANHFAPGAITIVAGSRQ